MRFGRTVPTLCALAFLLSPVANTFAAEGNPKAERLLESFEKEAAEAREDYQKVVEEAAEKRDEALDKARKATTSRLQRLITRRTDAGEQADIYRAILRVDRENEEAQKFFGSLGLLDKELAALPQEETPETGQQTDLLGNPIATADDRINSVDLAGIDWDAIQRIMTQQKVSSTRTSTTTFEFEVRRWERLPGVDTQLCNQIEQALNAYTEASPKAFSKIFTFYSRLTAMGKEIANTHRRVNVELRTRLPSGSYAYVDDPEELILYWMASAPTDRSFVERALASLSTHKQPYELVHKGFQRFIKDMNVPPERQLEVLSELHKKGIRDPLLVKTVRDLQSIVK